MELKVKVNQHVRGVITGMHPGRGTALNVSLPTDENARCELANLVGGRALLANIEARRNLLDTQTKLLALKGKERQFIVTTIEGTFIGLREVGVQAERMGRYAY